jgi:hypothetical protein
VELYLQSSINMRNLVQGISNYTLDHKCFYIGGRGRDVVRVLVRGTKIQRITKRGRGCRDRTKQWRKIARNLRITHLFLDFLYNCLSDFSYKINWETVRIYEWWLNEGHFVEFFVQDNSFSWKIKKKPEYPKFRISRTKSRIDSHSNFRNKTTVFRLTTTFVIRNLPLEYQIVLNKTYLPDNHSVLFRLYPLEKHCTTCQLPPQHYNILNRNFNFRLTTRYTFLSGSLTTRITIKLHCCSHLRCIIRTVTGQLTITFLG